jgi:hypothetical protein
MKTGSSVHHNWAIVAPSRMKDDRNESHVRSCHTVLMSDKKRVSHTVRGLAYAWCSVCARRIKVNWCQCPKIN